jgi:hypothetical protein
MTPRLDTSRLFVVSAAALLVAATGALVSAQASLANDITPAVPQSVTQPASPVDPSPIDGESYYLVNQGSGLQADLDGNAVVENARSFTNLSQRWAMTKAPDGNWLISDVGTGLCLDSAVVDAVTWTVQTRCRGGIATHEWSCAYLSNGYNAITNDGSHLVLGVLDSSPAAGAKLVQSTVTGRPSPSQSCLLRPTYFLGNDSSLQESPSPTCWRANSDTAPWWHDAYLPGQDLLQIFKDVKKH